MRKLYLSILCCTASILWVQAQQLFPMAKQRQDLYTLIDQYSQAREKKDTVLLKSILTDDIDQLVSSGNGEQA